VFARVQQRAAIRNVRAYLAISNDAIAVVAEIPPFYLMALEHNNAFEVKRGRLPVEAEDGHPEIPTANASSLITLDHVGQMNKKGVTVGYVREQWTRVDSTLIC